MITAEKTVEHNRPLISTQLPIKIFLLICLEKHLIPRKDQVGSPSECSNNGFGERFRARSVGGL